MLDGQPLLLLLGFWLGCVLFRGLTHAGWTTVAAAVGVLAWVCVVSRFKTGFHHGFWPWGGFKSTS